MPLSKFDDVFDAVILHLKQCSGLSSMLCAVAPQVGRIILTVQLYVWEGNKL